MSSFYFILDSSRLTQRRQWHPTSVLLPGKSQGRGSLVGDFTFTFLFPALEKGIAAHSSVLAWRIPGTGEPGGLPSLGWHRVKHDWSDAAAAAAAAARYTGQNTVSWIYCIGKCIHKNSSHFYRNNSLNLRCFLLMRYKNWVESKQNEFFKIYFQIYL